MQKYKKKATELVVDAAQVGSVDINELANWAQAFVVEEKDALTHEVFEALNVRTPNGMVRASDGMYVVKLNGHIFVSPRNEFERLYEPYVDPDTETDEVEEDYSHIQVPADLFKSYGGPKQI